MKIGDLPVSQMNEGCAPFLARLGKYWSLQLENWHVLILRHPEDSSSHSKLQGSSSSMVFVQRLLQCPLALKEGWFHGKYRVLLFYCDSFSLYFTFGAGDQAQGLALRQLHPQPTIQSSDSRQPCIQITAPLLTDQLVCYGLPGMGPFFLKQKEHPPNRFPTRAFCELITQSAWC
jgi:hypothetical protein